MLIQCKGIRLRRADDGGGVVRRRGSGRCGQPVPDDPVRLRLIGAAIQRSLPAVRQRTQRHLHRRGRRFCAAGIRARARAGWNAPAAGCRREQRRSSHVDSAPGRLAGVRQAGRQVRAPRAEPAARDRAERGSSGRRDGGRRRPGAGRMAVSRRFRRGDGAAERSPGARRRGGTRAHRRAITRRLPSASAISASSGKSSEHSRPLRVRSVTSRPS